MKFLCKGAIYWHEFKSLSEVGFLGCMVLPNLGLEKFVWEELGLFGSCGSCWCMARDFNGTIFPSKRSSRRRVTRSMRSLMDLSKIVVFLSLPLLTNNSLCLVEGCVAD